MTNHDLFEQEKQLFRSQMNGVTPLRKSEKKAPEQKPQALPVIRSAHRREIMTPCTKKLDVHVSSLYPEPVHAQTILAFKHHDFPNKRFRELKSGLIPWQARLDLHGLCANQAENALLTFLAQQINLNYRCVLIIHGKGGLDAEASILKSLINHWLRQIPEVLAFHSAIPRHGGTGAVSVFLKRGT